MEDLVHCDFLSLKIYKKGNWSLFSKLFFQMDETTVIIGNRFFKEIGHLFLKK